MRCDQIKLAKAIITEKDVEIARLRRLVDMQVQSSGQPNDLTVETLSQTDRQPVNRTCQSNRLSVKSATQSDLQPVEGTVQDNYQALNFAGFSSKFEETQLADIRLIGPIKREDSTFISVALRSLYHKRLELLAKKTITGRSKNGEKEMLTPENVETIKQLFKERMNHVEPGERAAREKNVNKYIKDAQINITKSLKSYNVVQMNY